MQRNLSFIIGVVNPDDHDEENYKEPTSLLTLKIVESIQSHMGNFNEKSTFEGMMKKVNTKLETIEKISKENVLLKKVHTLNHHVEVHINKMKIY